MFLPIKLKPCVAIALICLPFVCMQAVNADQWRWDGVDRVVAIADIHGAYPAFVELLHATDLIDEDLKWAGGTNHLVSLGDLLDRGSQSRAVMDILIRLQHEADAAGGRVHVVAGNHELMNVIGDLRYVSDAEYLAFSTDETHAMRDQAYTNFVNLRSHLDMAESTDRDSFDKQFPDGFFAHRAAFSAKGHYGKWILSMPAVVVVNDIAFVHGGLPEMVSKQSLEALNDEYRSTVSEFLQLWYDLTKAAVLPNNLLHDPSDLARDASKLLELSDCRLPHAQQTNCSPSEQNVFTHSQKLARLIAVSDSPVLGSNGPLWYRGAIYCPTILEGPILDAALKRIGANEVIVGHTPTTDSRAHTTYGGKLTTLDTGMLVEYYAGRPAALVIDDGERYVQYLSPNEKRQVVKNGKIEAYGLTEDELQQALMSGSIVSGHDIRGDSPRMVELTYNGKKLVARHYPENRRQWDKQEIAAYSLSQSLGLELVPLTVHRTIDGSPGALQLVKPKTISERERIRNNIHFAGWCSMQAQFSLMHVWDLLIGNSRRTADNLLYEKPLWRLKVVQHREAFGNAKKLPKGLRTESISLDHAVRNVLTNLNEETLQSIIGKYVSRKKILALLSRRDALLEQLDE